MRHLRIAITEVLGLKVKLLDSQPLPSHTHNLIRDQHHSTQLLEYLLSTDHEEANSVLGVTAVDLYIPIFTFVFGEAQLDGEAAVISMFRPNGGAGGVQPSRQALLSRLVKLALHEVGHNFGLGHCRQPHCLMGFSANLEKLDQKELVFCEYCRVLLADYFERPAEQ